MEWHILRTGRVWVDPGGPFGLVPRPLWIKKIILNADNLVPMDLNCLLIRSGGKTIVVDTGLGDKLSSKAQRNWGIEYPHGSMLENLQQFGVTPADVDIVIDTHLHADHCGGNTSLQAGQVVPTFPNATYYVQYVEWSQAMYPDARTRGTYLADNYVPIWEAGQLEFLYGDSQITSDVKCVVTPGHTRGHQSVVLNGDEHPILYLSDLATFSVNFERTGWLTAYDVEPLETIVTKEKWQKWALAQEATLVFEHDTQIPIGQLLRDDNGKLTVEKVEI